MAVPIAARHMTTEISPTARAAPSVVGKLSRVMPRNETTRAQMAKSAPQTWKAFTGGTLAKGVPEGPASAGCAPNGLGVFTDMSQSWLARRGTCALTPNGSPDRQHPPGDEIAARRPAGLPDVRPRGRRGRRADAAPRRRGRPPGVRHLRDAPPPHRRRAARLPARGALALRHVRPALRDAHAAG